MKQMSGKIIVSTIIDSHNYGTVLQAIATNEILRAYGEVSFLDYCRPRWTNAGWSKEILNGKYAQPVNIARLILQYPNWIHCKRIFRNAVKKYLRLVDAGPYLTGGTEFDKNAYYCVGSDQTWNSISNYGIDSVYYLAAVPNECFKFSFAASFGYDSLHDEEAVTVKRLLEGFRFLSVRERTGVALLHGIGLTNAIALKDPVLLCGVDTWNKISENSLGAGKGYLLVYQLNKNPEMDDYAGRVASEKGLKVKKIVFDWTKRVPHGWSRVLQPCIEEWISLFANASYVVTDSFHGTCFSLLFNIPMTVLDPPKFSVRLKDLLTDFGLKERNCANALEATANRISDTPIRWDSVNYLISLEQSRARDYLDVVFSGGGRNGR